MWEASDAGVIHGTVDYKHLSLCLDEYLYPQSHSFSHSLPNAHDQRWALEINWQFKALLSDSAPSSTRHATTTFPADASPIHLWTIPRDTWWPHEGWQLTPNQKEAINRSLAEKQGPRLGGADSHPDCFKLSCKLPPGAFEVTVWWGRKKHIISKNQRRDPEVPKLNVVLPPAQIRGSPPATNTRPMSITQGA